MIVPGIITRHYYKDTNERQYEMAKTQLENHKDKFLFYLSMGANPNCCDAEGNDYKKVLLKKSSEKRLEANQALVHLEKWISDYKNKKND